MIKIQSIVKQYLEKKLLPTELQQSTHSLFFYIICSLTLFVLFAQVLFDVNQENSTLFPVIRKLHTYLAQGSNSVLILLCPKLLLVGTMEH